MARTRVAVPSNGIADLIRKRAYQLFEARGRRQGHELDDWLQAEREIKHHLGSPDGDKQFMRRTLSLRKRNFTKPGTTFRRRLAAR